MCSDGMLEQSTDDNILNIITKSNVSDEHKLEMLRQVTEENKDNHTAHLIYIDKVEDCVASSEPTDNDSSEQHAKIKGILIKPKFRKPNKRKVLFGIIGVVVVAIIAVAASFFLLWGNA